MLPKKETLTYPRFSLATAVRALGKLQEMETDAFDTPHLVALLGRSKSGPTNKLISALVSYGLLTREGVKLKLSSVAHELLSKQLSRSAQVDLLARCALEPSMFLTILDTVGDPDGREDVTAWVQQPFDYDWVRKWLEQTYDHEAVTKCLRVLVDTLDYVREMARRAKMEAMAPGRQADPKPRIQPYRWDLGGGVVATLELSNTITNAQQVTLLRRYIDLLEAAVLSANGG